MIECIKFLAYIICSFGIAEIICYGNGPFHIFEKWREFTQSIHEYVGELFTCMMCLSTWIGLFFSLINIFLVKDIAFTPFNMIFGVGNNIVLTLIMDMGFTSGTVWLLHQLEEMMERTGNYETEYSVLDGEQQSDDY